MRREQRGVVAGLAVALFGGALVIGLLVALFSAASPSTKTVTVSKTTVQTIAATATDTTAKAPADPEVFAGAVVYTHFACGSCHGLGGEGGISPDVPALTGAGKEFTAAQLREIINHGAGVVDSPTKPFMPVWGPVISDNQVAQLVAYIKAGLPAVPGVVEAKVPANATPEVAGSILYETRGCINCHGPNGLGGVPNPSAPDKAVPPLTGKDFRAEFPPEAIATMIREGSVLGKAPIASMPHWGGILTDQQIQALVAYIGTLK
jgi:mono/diheme cytochrome c family protein